MKKLLIALLLVALLVPTALAEDTYTEWVTDSDSYVGTALRVYGVIVEIQDAEPVEPGHLTVYIMVDLYGDETDPIALEYSRPEGVELGLDVGWKTSFIGTHTGLLYLRSELGPYFALPRFEADQILAVPPNMELPDFAKK